MSESIKMKNKRCLIAVEGGMGKNVMLTALMPELSKYYEEIYVCTPYVDVFKVCPYVTDAFPMGQGSLYQELVLDEECDVLWKEPYSNSKFIKKKCHLFEAWAEEYGIELSKDPMEYLPQLGDLTTFANIGAIVNDIRGKYPNYVLVQLSGGQSPLTDFSKNPQYNNINEGIKRNYPYGQGLINLLRDKWPGHTIIHYALPNEPQYEGTQLVQAPYLAYAELAKYASEIVCIDSSLQHLAVANSDKVTVIWGETKPEHFGYAKNRNLVAKSSNLQPYFKPLGVSPSIVRYPKPEEVIIK